jgi:hypothetical protein
VRSRRIVRPPAAVSDPALAHDSSADGLIRRVGPLRSRPTPPAARPMPRRAIGIGGSGR